VVDEKEPGAPIFERKGKNARQIPRNKLERGKKGYKKEGKKYNRRNRGRESTGGSKGRMGRRWRRIRQRGLRKWTKVRKGALESEEVPRGVNR
jgi:hypothetical protein